MSEWTSIPAASGLTTASAAAEAMTGMGNDLSGDLSDWVGLLRLFGLFESRSGTTMDLSDWQIRVVEQQCTARQEGYRGRLKSPQRDQYHAGRTRRGKSPMTRSKPLGPC